MALSSARVKKATKGNPYHDKKGKFTHGPSGLSKTVGEIAAKHKLSRKDTANLHKVADRASRVWSDKTKEKTAKWHKQDLAQHPAGKGSSFRKFVEAKVDVLHHLLSKKKGLSSGRLKKATGPKEFSIVKTGESKSRKYKVVDQHGNLYGYYAHHNYARQMVGSLRTKQYIVSTRKK